MYACALPLSGRPSFRKTSDTHFEQRTASIISASVCMYFLLIILLRRPDSNWEYKCQKLGCCRYTTAQFRMLYPNGNVGSKFNDKPKLVTCFVHSVCGRANKRINVGFNLKFHSDFQQVKRHFRFHCHSIYHFREPARAVGLLLQSRYKGKYLFLITKNFFIYFLNNVGGSMIFGNQTTVPADNARLNAWSDSK